MNRREFKKSGLFFVILLVVITIAPSLAWTVELKDGIDKLAILLAKGVPEHRRMTVAVTDFPDLRGMTSDLGRFIGERLTTRLSQFPRFRVIERRRLAQVLAELKFAMSDLVDPTKAKKLGRMLGVEGLVVGTVSDLGSTVDIDARIIEIDTGNVLLGASTNISKDPMVAGLMQRGRAISDKPISAPEREAGKFPTPRKPYVNFGKLVVTLNSLRLLSDNRVTVSLGFLNRTKEEFVAAINTYIHTSYAGKEEVFVTDNVGNRYPIKSASSIRGTKGPWLTCPPGIEVTATITFSAPRKMRERGSRFSPSIPITIGKTYVDENNRRVADFDSSFNVSFKDVPQF